MKIRTINFIISIILYIAIIIIDRLYLVELHKSEIKWIKETQKLPFFFEILFWIATYIFYYIIIALSILSIFFLKQKKHAVLFITIIFFESFLKKFLAVLFKEKRPFFENSEISQNAHCVCVFGNPSGHLSGTTLCYFIICYFICFSKKRKIWVKILVYFFYAFLVLVMAVSRYFYAGHYINQLVLGIVQGYFFISLFLILENSDIFNIFLNLKKLKNQNKVTAIKEVDLTIKNKNSDFNNENNINLNEDNDLKKEIDNKKNMEETNNLIFKNESNNIQNKKLFEKDKKIDIKSDTIHEKNISNEIKNNKHEKINLKKKKYYLTPKNKRIIFFSIYFIVMLALNISYIIIKYDRVNNFEKNPYHPFIKNYKEKDNICVNMCFINKTTLLSNSSFATSVILNFTLFLWIFILLEKKPLFENNKNFYRDICKSWGFFFKRALCILLVCLPIGFLFIFILLFGQTWYCYLINWFFVFIFAINFVYLKKKLFYKFDIYVKGDLFY